MELPTKQAQLQNSRISNADPLAHEEVYLIVREKVLPQKKSKLRHRKT